MSRWGIQQPPKEQFYQRRRKRGTEVYSPCPLALLSMSWPTHLSSQPNFLLLNSDFREIYSYTKPLTDRQAVMQRTREINCPRLKLPQPFTHFRDCLQKLINQLVEHTGEKEQTQDWVRELFFHSSHLASFLSLL